MKRDLITELYNTYYRKLVEYVKKFVTECEAEDLVQTFFLNLLNGKISPENIETQYDLRKYAYSCIKNICLDRTRHNTTKNKIMDNLQKSRIKDVEFPEQDYMQENIRELISNELNKLSPICKKIVILRFYDNLSVKKIAASLELKTRTVESHLYRTIRDLKKNTTIIVLLKQLLD